MNPGAFRHRIRIWDRGEKKDVQGYLNPEKKLLYTCRARRADASNREVWEGYAAKVRNIVNFQLRPVENVRPGMWVEFEGQWHEIVAVQRGSYLNAPMTLKTVLKEAI